LNKKPAVFLDRDGVLTVERGYICPIDEVEIFPYAAECVRKIHKKGFLAIVITNQSGVARGLFTKEELEDVHSKIKSETAVDAIYYCPHYVGGKIKNYAFLCHCRKPDIGMVKRACRDFDIDLQHSYMVGDRAGDIIVGQKAGLKTVLLESGYGFENLEQDIKPDYILEDLREFVNCFM